MLGKNMSEIFSNVILLTFKDKKIDKKYEFNVYSFKKLLIFFSFSYLFILSNYFISKNYTIIENQSQNITRVRIKRNLNMTDELNQELTETKHSTLFNFERFNYLMIIIYSIIFTFSVLFLILFAIHSKINNHSFFINRMTDKLILNKNKFYNIL